MNEMPPELESDGADTADAANTPAPTPVHHGPTHPERPQRATSMGVVYFMIGFTMAAFLSMFALMFLRPLMGELSAGARMGAMLAPLALGILYGARVSWLGVRDNLRLTAALKRGLGLR